MQSVDALIAQIEAAELKYNDHSKRMSSPAGSASAGGGGGGKARGGKRKAAELAETKTAVALAEGDDDDDESASASASKSAPKAAKKAKKGAPKDANDFLSTLSREVLKVLRKAGIINTANQLIKAKVLMAHEYRAIAKLTSTDPPSAHPKIFERLLKWQITMPGEYADEDEDDEDDDDDEDEDEDDDEDEDEDGEYE